MDDTLLAELRKSRQERLGSEPPATRVMPAVGQMMRAQADWAVLQAQGAEQLAAWRERRSRVEWTFSPSTGSLTQ